MTRTGKIARLPRDIRAQLNRRLQDAEPGRRLVAWLNSLPEVQAVLARDFSGHPINEVNLSDWKTGGYQDWLLQQQTLSQAADLAAQAEELSAATQGRLPDHLVTILTARYAAELAAWNSGDAEKISPRLHALRALCHDLVDLQRSSANAARVRIEQARLQQSLDKTEDELIAIFREWSRRPAVRALITREAAESEAEDAQWREVFASTPDDENQPCD